MAVQTDCDKNSQKMTPPQNGSTSEYLHKGSPRKPKEAQIRVGRTQIS